VRWRISNVAAGIDREPAGDEVSHAGAFQRSGQLPEALEHHRTGLFDTRRSQATVIGSQRFGLSGPGRPPPRIAERLEEHDEIRALLQVRCSPFDGRGACQTTRFNEAAAKSRGKTRRL